MNTINRLWTILFLAVCAMAQVSVPKEIIRGQGVPPAGRCAALSQVGTDYVDTNPSGLSYTCTRTGENAFTWTQVGSGGGGGGGTNIGFAPTRDSSTVIGVGSGTARSGNVATSFAASTATLGGTSSTGTAYVYVSGGTLFIGHNTAATITCSACTTATSIAVFPSGSIPIATATFTGNIWDVSGITDFRAALGTTPVIGGSGVTVTQSSGVYTVAATGSSTSACASNQVVPISLEINADFQTGGQLQFTALANRAYAFVLPCTGSPARFGFSVETASGTCSGTCGMAVAFYDDSGNRLANATVATSGGSPNINTTGFKSLTISSPPTLTGGVRYYVAISTDSTALKLLAPNSWTTCSNRNAMATYCATAANSSTGSGGSIASPATLGTLTPTDGASAASMWPYLYLRF